MKLSIVIPTYNRNTTLFENLPTLLMQIKEGVELIILDNSSTIPVVQSIQPLLDEYSDVPITILRHKINIGAEANFLRSFEIAASPWIWILGDDDVVSENAVVDAIQTIEAHTDCIFFNFITSSMSISKLRPLDFETVGQHGFVTGLDYPGNINFMSVGIWHAPSFLSAVPNTYHYAYSMSFTFIMLLSALGNTGRCLFSNKALIDTVNTAPANTKWQYRKFIMGWNTILELPMSNATRKMLASKMYSWHAPESVCIYFLAEAAAKQFRGHYYVLVSNRLTPYVGIFARVRFLLYRPLFWYPKIGWSLAEFILKMAVRLNIKKVDIKDIVDRSTN
jgi:glycosyltransferase involved in cell wall biosynthesis